jgi:hypothetical protein
MRRAMSNGPDIGAGHDAAMPIDDVMVVLRQFFAAILIALILGLANVDVGGLIDATTVLPLGDPAAMSNFTA